MNSEGTIQTSTPGTMDGGQGWLSIGDVSFDPSGAVLGTVRYYRGGTEMVAEHRACGCYEQFGEGGFIVYCGDAHAAEGVTDRQVP